MPGGTGQETFAIGDQSRTERWTEYSCCCETGSETVSAGCRNNRIDWCGELTLLLSHYLGPPSMQAPELL